MTEIGYQTAQMRFDPVTGTKEPYPSLASHYREWHGNVAWLYNPWSGAARDPRHIGSDVTGLLIVPGPVAEAPSHPTTAEPASHAPNESDEELNRAAVRALMERVLCLSYNDSYYGERPGAVKQDVMEWVRQRTLSKTNINQSTSNHHAAAISREVTYSIGDISTTEREFEPSSAQQDKPSQPSLDEIFARLAQVTKDAATPSPEQ